MTEKLTGKDLKGIFKGHDDVRVGPPESEGPTQGSETYNKYGIFCPPHGEPVFICVVMEHNDESETPADQLTEDDYVQHSVKRWDFGKGEWVGGHGLMNLISRSSFSFMEKEDDFWDQLFKHKDLLASRGSAAAEAAPEERQP